MNTLVVIHFLKVIFQKKKSSWNVERLCNRKCFSCLWWYWFGIWFNMSFSITSSQESLFSSLCTNCKRRGVWCGIKFSQHLWIYLLDNVLMLYFQGQEATRTISVVGWRFLEGRGCLKEDGGVFRVGTGTFKETVLHDNMSWVERCYIHHNFFRVQCFVTMCIWRRNTIY